MVRLRMRLAGFTLTLLVLSVPLAGAQHQYIEETAFSWTRPGYRHLPSYPPYENIPERAAEKSGIWADFEAHLGTGWSLTRHPTFQTPSWILGPGVDTGMAPLTPDQAVSYSRNLASKIQGALGLDLHENPRSGLELDRTACTPNPEGHTILGVDFIQTLDGYEVRTLAASNRVKFRFDATLGRLSALGSDFLPGLQVRTRNPMARPAAEFYARELVPAHAPGTGRILEFRTYVLVGKEEDGRNRADLVHDIMIQVDTPPHLWHVILDAFSGDPFHVADDLRHGNVTGMVSAGVLTGPAGAPPSSPFSVEPLHDLLVNLKGGGSTYTSTGGRFSLPTPTPIPVPLLLTGNLTGRWCSVLNLSSSNAGFTSTVKASQPVNIVMNGSHTHEWTTAETTAYYWTSLEHSWIHQYIPGYSSTPLLKVIVNRSDITCNAYYNGSSTNYACSGGGCHNTASPDVILHESGHFFHHTWHRSLNPGWFSEGIADHIAMYITGQYEMGRNFFKTGATMRDYRPGKSACCTQWPPTNKEVHKAGEIWAGFTVDLRENLIAKLGAGPGTRRAEIITVAQYSRNPNDMPDGVIEILIQDDDDANLKNGTPNFREIAAAADAHSLRRPPDPGPVIIIHSPVKDTGDVVNGYPVTATITTTQAAVKGVTLSYRVGNGVYQVKAMSLTTVLAGTGARYTAVIPAQKSPPVVMHYKITAVDTLNNSATSPEQGDHMFVVGRVYTVFADDFETDKGWLVNSRATSGLFERADPNQAASTAGVSQPEDDHTPDPGKTCFITENGRPSQDPLEHDVDKGFTSIISPALDLSGQAADSVRLDFAYWFTDYNAVDDALTVEISYDGGQTFKVIWSETTPADIWKETRIGLPGPYTQKTKIRFQVSDNPNNSVCDVLIDDVVVEGADNKVAMLTAQTRRPTPGSLLNYSLKAASAPNGAYIFSIAFSPGSTEISGVGTSRLGWPFFPLFIGPLDNLGKATFPLPVPSHNELKGLKVYTEAFVGGQNRLYLFSNRWDLEIT